MGIHFRIVRKKTRLAAILNAVMLGAGLGLFSTAALVLVLKLLAYPIAAWYYLLLPVVALLGGGVAYLCLMPSDKRLAKRLDEEHGLQEKMRTMIAFRHADDAFSRLQREDADEKLGRVKVSFFRKRQLIAAILVLVLSSACLTGAVLVPGAEEPGEEVISDQQKLAILAEITSLIDLVDGSPIHEPLKESTLADLRGLYTFVDTHNMLSEMKAEGIRVVLRIHDALDRTNSAPFIGEKLLGSQTATLSSLGKELADLSAGKMITLLSDLKDGLKTAEADDAAFVADELRAALTTSGAESDNTLVVLFGNLVAGLRSYANGDITLDAVFATAPMDILDEVMLQNVNNATLQKVISRLCTLFGISTSDLAEAEGGGDIDIRPPSGEEQPPLDIPDVEEPDGDIGGGGIGTGDRVYGSNDMIYNPYTNTYVSYGEVLDAYNAKATDKIIDGKIPPDFIEFIETYFKNLSEYKPDNEASENP